MKYGLDINLDFLREKVERALKDNGHMVVSMNKLEYYNKGDMLVKKVLLANQTRVDFYLKLDINEAEKSKIVLYGDQGSKSLKLYKELSNYKGFFIVKIEYAEGLHYYLIKNIKSSVVLLDIKFRAEDLDYDKIAEFIVKALLSLSEAD